tara:strand:+ start:1845 stop:4250 length:2406 start_codon:yes stop_codon:yes gene_type:complete
MGRVVTGRGDVFNYKRGEMTRGMETVKPYDYGKLMTNIHRGAIITEKVMETPLLSSGSPLITAPKAAYGAAKEGAKWAGTQLGLRDEDPLSEAVQMKAIAEGKVQPRPPAALPAAALPAADPVAAPPAAKPVASGRPGRSLEEITKEFQSIKPLSSYSMGDWAAISDIEKNAINDRILSLQREYEETKQALPPQEPSQYQRYLDRHSQVPSVISPQAPGIDQRLAERGQPPMAVPRPEQVSTAQPPVPSPLATKPDLAGIGPESKALYGGLDQRRDVGLKLKQEAHRQLKKTADRGTTEQRAQAMGLKGMDLLKNRPFNTAFREVATELGMEPQALANSMWAESEMDPTNVNTRSGATGMIQFTGPTARELGTTPEAIGALNPIDQLEVVKEYFLLRKKQFPALDYSNPNDVDIAIFAPARAGDSLDTAMYTQGGSNPKQYSQNIEIDQFGPQGRPGRSDGKITVQERLTWMQDQAKQKGGPVPTLESPRDLPPEPTRQDVTAQDMVQQREQVNAGSLVVPGVKPSQMSLGNMLVMARNVKSDADKNWVRQLALDDDADIPWTSLGDLFTGKYKQRAAKAIEDAFPKLPDVLYASKVDLNIARADKARRLPPVKVASSGKGKGSSKAPQRWKHAFDRLNTGIAIREKRRSTIQEFIESLGTGEGKVNSKQFTSPTKGNMESDDDFNNRQTAWNDAMGVIKKYDGNRKAALKDLRKKLHNVSWQIKRFEKVLNEGTALSTTQKYFYGPPPAWINRYQRSMGQETGPRRRTFIPPNRKPKVDPPVKPSPNTGGKPLFLGRRRP